MDRLKGKRVIITGATGGMGRVACSRFAKEGARILATDLSTTAASEIEALGPGQIRYVGADVIEKKGIDAIVSSAIEWFGGSIDVLYNNHGAMLGKPFLETTPEEWDFIQNVDLKSVYFLSQRAVPAMPKGSSIINISSVGGLTAVASMSAYAAAKGGLIMLTRAMAVDLNENGIRVNAIAPGAVDTPMPQKFLNDLPPAERHAARTSMEGRHIMKRFAEPHEIVNLAVFLASDEASFMTGSVVTVDGGWTAF